MGGILAVLLVAALALAAGGGAPPRVSKVSGDLRVELVLSKTAYRVGEPVGVTLHVFSTLPGPLAVATSGQTHDVFVRQRGALVWQWSHDKAFAQVIREFTLSPGKPRTYREDWDQRDLQGRQVEPGAYEVSAVFLGAARSGPAPAEVGPVRITIGP